jgi:glutathione S-transferase
MRLTDDFLKMWPHAMVPLLELDDGTRFSEALGIVRYFEDLHPEPNLLGATPVERAMVTMWERRGYDEGMVGTAEVVRNSLPVFYDRGLPGTTEITPQIPALIDRGHLRVGRFYKKLEDQLKTSRYVAANRFTFADITNMCAMDFAIFGGMPIPEDCPNVTRWYKEVSSRPAAPASV